jgi:HEAT repeat protein
MRPIVVCVLALVSGCSSMQRQARIRHEAEAVVWSEMASPSAEVRQHATRIVALVADPTLDPGLGPRLGDPSPSVRATAAVALVKDVPAAADVLRAVLEGNDGEPEPGVSPSERANAKVIAIDAIGALDDGKQRLATLAADRDVRVRARVATAIAQWKPAGARALLDKLAHDPDAGVRGQALAGLARYGDESALGEVAQALDDPSLGVRLAALGALVHLGRDAVGNRLLALGSPSEKDRYVALRAAVQLSRVGRARAALPAVRAAADDRDPALRVAAMNAAGELGADGYALATAHLRDPDLDVRLAAARAVIAAGPHEPAIAPLVGALSTPRRLDAADELARLGDQRGFAALEAAARSTDARERRTALALLAPLPVGDDVLAGALRDHDVDIRLDAAGAILRRMFRFER